MSRPDLSDLTGDNELAKIARETWLATANPPKVLPSTVTKLWKLVEEDGCSAFSLLLLEQLQALERYLWPGYTSDSSNQHVLLLALLVNTKRQEHLPTWPTFASNPERADDFADFFRRVAQLSIDQSLSTTLRSFLLTFIVGAYQSLDHGIIRKECAPLVSIGIWHNLHDDATRERHLGKRPQLQKAWRAAGKKLDNEDAAGQAKLRFQRSWLHTLLLQFLDKLYDADAGADTKQENVLFCERFLELLCDLQSQLPTRRYVNTLLKDMNVLSAIRLSFMYQDEEVLKEMYQLLAHYTHFPIEDQTGEQLSRQAYEEVQNAEISRLQKVSLKLQPEKLKILVLTNFGALSQRQGLEGHMQALTDQEVLVLCKELGLRTAEYPEKSILVRDRTFFVETLVEVIEKKPYYTERLRTLRVLPTEETLYDDAMLRVDEHDHSRPLPIPKLNLQYLTIGDFLYRSFVLYRHEALYGIRKHIEDTIKRLKPRLGGGITRFDGFSRLAIPISKPGIIDVVAPRVGEVVPAEAKVEVVLDVSRLQPGLRREWETLRPDDVVFLLALHPQDTSMKLTNGNSKHSAAKTIGLKHVRCAEVISVLDENSRPLRQGQEQQDYIDGAPRPRSRRLLLRLDAAAYKADKERADAGKGDIYESVNVVVRRRARENNFRPVLESIKQLAVSDAPVPSWLQEVFLGYGDPQSATYKRLPNRLNSVDYRDTFLDWQHLIESLAGKTLEPDPKFDTVFPPPYVLESTGTQPAPAPPKKNKKRKHDQPDGPEPAPSAETYRVSTYKPPSLGPYPTDVHKLNGVRFTPIQVEAITSGTQPGLTMIVGPPGTGKTDVATQIINNIYHNFPQQRTLLIAHSNQALNQLFQKIVALDIDDRHLLRLGHGEEELTTEASFSKAGRVESFNERAGHHLAEVQRLAASIGAVGAHGSSCENADYFDQVWVQPLWKRYRESCKSDEAKSEDLVTSFPFHSFFADAPQPLFVPDASKEQIIETAEGCERHIRRVFDELADIRPFEILRAQRDKANYLLVKEARIIAMTSTHAAIRRQEIANLGFHYDNVIMEEAAQITEVENFVPFVLQAPRTQDGKPAESQLQRIVLVGDHLQNSPVIQNNTLKTYANLEQSLFQRLIRLGVPHIQLDAQGRSRPSLAALYKWRYPTLQNLPFTSTAPEFVAANAGLRYDYQFIDVPDYQEKGETEPTPHFLQNLGEAEYAVALYQYMRLLGYPAEKITILTAYAGQKALIKNVLDHRCKENRLFDLPGWLGTVDKYQGEQNDYVILSLVRTKSPGYLRDLRRLTVALSRARLGLYVFGRREVFESSLELREAFATLFERSDKLSLVTNEMFPASRELNDKAPEGVAEMAGVEHLGQYVFQMTQAKVKALKEGASQLPPPAVKQRIEAAGDDEDDEEDDTAQGGGVDEDGDEELM
ncbi:RNA helicase aquarius [Fulvia fulva]|uniref:Pre-mRNA-splicing factor n=1 Tax=Passalora fulva TaxID=5499 RepID=A0A9Q8PCT0_PASFU|nr:RNA helicase aquarius [Fulvia fulva]KAK4619880.1 RNA helicase aquarius [Fulvia fulva]KAK4620958.1 RNA helicase aquarius [Fulvia fulva]UJO20103.1 RNA helicase aquarius [Fulvia fulva]WPV17047.1 RNA helicase aquarius [Fulvia fulva]WPV32426.1 RNA helicase aquarius [Fulvia fulva]